MEIRGAQAVLMTEGGAFEKVKNKNYRVGQQVSWAKKRRHPALRWLLAASILLVFMTGTGTLAARLPFTYVSLDINPSLEYSLNWFDRVISVRAVNDDAEPIARKLLDEGVIDQPADRAIGMTLSELHNSRYVVSGSENDVILAVASYGIKNVDGLTKRLAESADEYGRQNSVSITTVQADSASIKRSRELKTTAGKLMLVESLGALEGNPSGLSKEEWLKKSVRDLLDRKKSIQQKPSADGPEAGVPTPAPSVAPSVAPSAAPSAAPVAGPVYDGEGKVNQSNGNTPSATISPENSLSPTSPGSKPKNTKSPDGASHKKNTPKPSATKNDKPGSSNHSSQGNSGHKQDSPPKNPHAQDASKQGSTTKDQN